MTDPLLAGHPVTRVTRPSQEQIASPQSMLMPQRARTLIAEGLDQRATFQLVTRADEPTLLVYGVSDSFALF
jgi:hypothetical protein